MIRKILVANRGEIAIRVMRSAREMGIESVAVYSEADRKAPHTRYADEAVLIGPAASKDSYLRGDVIIEKALACGADAIHPGYGFLSENADFAREVAKAGLIFIGPPPEAIRIMGNKLAAKAAVKDYDIPMVPGTDEPISDKKKALEIASKIGFPILIKAAAGGGGKGMRIVDRESEFLSQMDRAVGEAQSAFGDGSVFIEKYVEKPRHVEIQVLCDQHGNCVDLFERECSVQRRHQKVIEEAPSAVITDEMRKRMGRDAVKVARACNYVNAGTVEFLLDADMNYYFLEMNTRLQVEHPVTECITGLDLVKEQIKIAAGKKLDIRRDKMEINGHAIELRVYAEDPTNNFLPDIGTLHTYETPSGPGVRVDDGYEAGMEIPIYYDPMIAKLIVHGKDRKDAIERMIRAIDEYKISGVATTLPFGRFVMEHPAFESGDFDTHFVQNHFRPEVLTAEREEEASIAALLAVNELISKKPVNGHGLDKAPLRGNWYLRRKS